MTFIMSEDNKADTSTSFCASCGIAEVDDIKLVPCDGCGLVRYCSVNCQRDHISRHLLACKQRVRDEILFKQPESSHLGDCPICMIPLPIHIEKSAEIASCCSKINCVGCSYAHQKREIEMRLDQKCPFCRMALPETDEECDKRRMKRVEMNDPDALCHEGAVQYYKGEYSSAFEYFTKAAKLGDAEAHYKLAYLYHDGDGVENDMEKVIYNLEEAAIAGHPLARYNLGWHEYIDDNIERAVKHFFIGATHGEDNSIKFLMEMFKEGLVVKDVLAAALRAHKVAVDATKSSQREEAEVYYRVMGLM